MTRTIALLLFLIASFTNASASSSISECMPQDLQIDTGLSKLSRIELGKLSTWLSDRGFECSCASEQNCVTETNAAEFSVKSNGTVSELRATIEGDFRGWTGNTVFVLSDGSEWQQRAKGVKPLILTNPEVRVFKNWLGFYELEIIATGDKVKVKKVR
jgi:hypothetical protein